MKTKAVNHPRFHLHREKKSQGFALIATILLMVLLAIITVGTLSLSVVTIRSAAQDSAHAHARANARMALMLAIGEIQKYAGPDTRITAPSGIVDQSAAPLTGVWKSWDGTDHAATGRPNAPSYALKDQTVANNGYFLKWLVSTATPTSVPDDASSLASTTQSGNLIELLSSGTLGENGEGRVYVAPTPVNQTGSYAWWVSGENQKARLPKPYKPISENVAQLSTFSQSHNVADPKPFTLDSLLVDPAEFTPDPANPKPVDKAFSRDTADFLVANDTDPKPREFFHDLSTSSVGLLTNTATGGWRKDLSILTENWNSIVSGLSAGETLPMFRFSSYSGDVSQSNIPTVTNPKPASSLLYPWSTYLGSFPVTPAHDHNGAVNSWRNLVDYATYYKNLGASGSATVPLTWASFPDIDAVSAATAYDYLHKVRPLPVVARFHWVYSFKTVKFDSADPDPSKHRYNLQLLVTPVFTIWNPYNIAITVPNLRIELQKSPPCLIQFQKADGTLVPFKRLIRGVALDGISDVATTPAVFNHTQLRYNINNPFTLRPGQTIVYSANGATAASAVNMSPGLNSLSGGHLATINDATTIGGAGTNLIFGPTDIIKANLKFTYEMNHTLSEIGKGIRLQVFGNTNRMQMFYLMSFEMTDAEANLYWPPISSDDLAQSTADDLLLQKPFFSTIFGSRVVSDSNLPGKGLLQSNPLTSYSNGTQNVAAFPGCTHPVNSALDYSFVAHALGGDSRLPNAGASNIGYIVSGFDSGTGLSRVIVNDFPLRPISSLGQLQNWDMRSQNSRPPFPLNVIGNSDATPLIAKNRAFRTPHVHDDSYCANHVLFDDWFVSSIAPNPTSFGTAGDNMRAHYIKFLTGKNSLTNRSYVSIKEDSNHTDPTANTQADDILNTKDGWRRVASRFEVEGMFNVNSTSVTAWRALLGHARGQKIPYFTPTGMATSSVTDHAVSRFSVAGDAMAGGPGMSGTFNGSSEFTGYRVFTDKMLDTLAEKIVDQVRLRGPFLSLSEFVNRQLTNNNDELALAGAIQTALNQLSDGTADDPQSELKALSVVTNAAPPGDERYLFSKAAEGHSSYGMPGWIRQADILSPLAPILSARDDTFTIRAYGDAKDKNGKIIARAWCEATVRRTRDFIDSTDSAESIDAPEQEINVAFGRRFEMISFQWLSPDEV